jgi:hypothetical protein
MFPLLSKTHGYCSGKQRASSWFALSSNLRRIVPYFYGTLAAFFSAAVSQLTSRFPLIIVAGGFGPYHRLWPNDAPSKCIVVTPTSGGMIGAVGLVAPTPKPPNILYHLHTTRLKVFLVSGSTNICPDII